MAQYVKTSLLNKYKEPVSDPNTPIKAMLGGKACLQPRAGGDRGLPGTL